MQSRTTACFLSLVALAATSAYAQAVSPPTPPPTQDSQLRALLGLGDALGCAKLLGLVTTSQTDIAVALTTAKISKELRAICGPSAVSSASSLSGGINTPQATKSTSTFRPRPRPRSKRPSAPRRAADLGIFEWGASSTAFQSGGGLNDGVGVFGGIELDRRDRANTNYESGYTSDLTGVTGGLDYRKGGAIVGGWVGTTRANADFTHFGALLTGVSDATSRAFVASPSNLSAVCGGLSTAGGFEDRATHVGGFGGASVGSAGFIEGSVGWTRLEHSYNRSVCAIEGNSGLKLGTVNGKTVLLDDNGTQLDDIFAGTISGVRKGRELTFAVGGGGDFGTELVSFAPRAELTVRRATSDAYAETGRSTVMGIEIPNTGTGKVTPNEGDPVIVTLGGNTGLELAFDPATRTSIVLETGGVLSARFGSAVPYVAGYWRREFKDQFYLISAHMAGDLRTTPASFTFGHDAFDRDSLLFKLGCTVSGQRGGLRLEWAMNRRDALFKSRTLSAHAIVLF